MATTPTRRRPRYRPVRKNLLGLGLTLAVVGVHSQLWSHGVITMNLPWAVLYLAECAAALYFVVSLVLVLAVLAAARGRAIAMRRRFNRSR